MTIVFRNCIIMSGILIKCKVEDNYIYINNDTEFYKIFNNKIKSIYLRETELDRFLFENQCILEDFKAYHDSFICKYRCKNIVNIDLELNPEKFILKLKES